MKYFNAVGEDLTFRVSQLWGLADDGGLAGDGLVAGGVLEVAKNLGRNVRVKTGL